MNDNNQAIVILALIYLAPAWIAVGRKHKSAAAIAVLNILLGWIAYFTETVASHGIPFYTEIESYESVRKLSKKLGIID